MVVNLIDPVVPQGYRLRELLLNCFGNYFFSIFNY